MKYNGEGAGRAGHQVAWVRPTQSQQKLQHARFLTHRYNRLVFSRGEIMEQDQKTEATWETVKRKEFYGKYYEKTFVESSGVC